jgi:hypothetical protein
MRSQEFNAAKDRIRNEMIGKPVSGLIEGSVTASVCVVLAD